MRTRILRGSQARAARSQRPTPRPNSPAARAQGPPSDGNTAPTRATPADPVADAEPGALQAYDLRARTSDGPLVLGRYRLRRRLGAGGFASVWLAHDERLDRQVAVKMLPRERIIGGRFEREARAAARLAHPGIVMLYEAAVDDEGAYLVSEVVRGTTLDQLLAAGRLSDRDVVRIGIVLCDALSHAHAHGVIHRDVKPSNVLVPDRPTTPAQLARLTDFGVARLVGGASLTRTGDVIGTDAYMAPEQAQGLPAGEAADLFSLALVLYEALSGTNPRRGAPSTAQRRAAHLPPLRRQRRDLPRELGQAIDLALRPRPSERGRLEELRAALVASVARVADEPGVVADPWPTRTLTRPRTPDQDPAFEDAAPLGRRRTPRPDRSRPDKPRPDKTRAKAEEHPPAGVPWPRRGLAGLAAAFLAAWLAGHAAGTPVLPAALAAWFAGLLVLAVPRAGWLILAVAAAAWLIIESRPGEALVLLVAAAIPVVAAPRDGPAWPLAAAAPALGTIGLAAAWPALAGLTARAHRRAALGATGWFWTALAGQHITAHTTLPDAIHHVLGPLVTVGTLMTAAVWAAAAVALPFTRSRRWPALECMRLALWAVALGVGTLAVEHAAGAPHTDTVFLGAGAGALVALATSRCVARLTRARLGNDQAPTA